MLNYRVVLTDIIDLRLRKHQERLHLISGFEAQYLQGEKVNGRFAEQLVEMAYALQCDDEYYLIWDGDTIPCREINMFAPDGRPYLDIRTELREDDGEWMDRLVPGLEKMIEKSFCSGHILVRTAYMRELIGEINDKKGCDGSSLEESIRKVLREDEAFCLYEFYGNYVLSRHPEAYRLREWHSFRQGGDLFDPESITERDFDWLGQDFDAITFVSGRCVREDNKGLFDHPDYQRKYRPGQLLQAAQGEYKDDYIAGWESGAMPVIAEYQIKKQLRTEEYLEYKRLGDSLVEKNPRQAYLCWQHAAFLCKDRNISAQIKEKMAGLNVTVPKTAIVIVSYNAHALMRSCLESIRQHSSPDEYTIIVVDNASQDEVREYLKEQKDIVVQYNDENTGFPAACNQGILLAPEGEDIFFLNNDTRMTHNALFWLRMGLYESEDTGAVGCVGNYAGIGQMKELLLATPEEYTGYAGRVNVSMAEPYRDAKLLCGFAMLVRRDIIDQYGGMDEAFSPGYFEDTDLSLRIRQQGYRLRICDNSFIYHAGGESFKKREDAEAIEERNFIRLTERWGTDFMER